jgi:hypothetical protein
MKTEGIMIKTLLIGVLLVMAVKDANAVMKLSECLSVTGFARYEFGIHTAESNPNLAENHDLTLSRFFLQTEWTYKPSDLFKVFANIRVLGDTTYHWDSNLDRYNAFPIDVPDYDWTMMEAHEDDFRAEVWELYADITLGNLWLRLGKQQIAWGEMIGSRILDTINPLDLSWNFQFEPEEFEIIRIPNWSIRGIYNLYDLAPSWIANPSIEAFVNPGDVLPNQYADRGAPFFLINLPPFLRVTEKDNRGKAEYGFRLGGMIGGFYGTLNYLHLYSDEFNFNFRGLQINPTRPFVQLLMDAEYKSMDMYGASLNYAFDQPWNLVVTFEGLWIPDQPYGDAGSPTPAIRDQGTWKYAINLNRPTPILPRKFLHASYMMIQLQFGQTWVEGDEDKVLGAGDSRVDKNVDTWVLLLQQPLLHNDLTLAFQMLYDPDDAYFIKPSVKYSYGDYWYFDIFATFLGGSEDRTGRFGSLYWADSVYGRVTYQF